MPIYRSKPTIRAAGTGDHANLVKFLNHEGRVHRHLDWRAPLEWLGCQPFLLAEQGNMIQAVLACPPDPPHVAWIRLFAASGPLFPRAYFQMLLEAARAQLRDYPEVTVAAIGLQQWFQSILSHSGFSIRQHIVVLEWAGQLQEEKPLPPGLRIRPMKQEDLPTVAYVDQAAFEPIWQNSLESLSLAFEQSTWSTVAESATGIVGYQISTSVPLTGHLARLAVLPGLRRSHIGFGLVHNLQDHFKHKGAWRVTVNTQDNNLASLALYEAMGFRRTGETFPVFQLNAD